MYCIQWYLTSSLIAMFYVSVDDAYKILIYNPRFSQSHIKFMGSIADTLTELAPVFFKVADSTGSKLAKTIKMDIDAEISKIMNIEVFAKNAWKQKQQSFLSMITTFNQMSHTILKSCEFQLKQKKIMEELKAEKFDLAIFEFNQCFAGMIELFHIPAHIVVSATALFGYATECFGVPNNPSYIPALYSQYADHMTYLQRVKNLIITIVTHKFFENLTKQCQMLFRRLHGDQFIDLKEKLAQATYVLTNTNPLFDVSRPTIHKMIELGGLALPKRQPLSKDWTVIMDERKPIVLVSFGTITLSYWMPNETKQALLETFDSFPNVTFIWKYEKDEHRIADGHPNVITSKWLPQTDLLAHKNLIAFLTHGGMNSIMETLNYGKPVVVVPLFGDQLQNAVLVERSGFGIRLPLPELAMKEKLQNAIYNIIYDKSYAQKAERLSKMMAKKPNPAKEQLIKHVEFAAEFGQIANFDPYGRKMTFVSYYMLDIIIPFMMFLLLISLISCYIIIKLFKNLFHKGINYKSNGGITATKIKKN
uniref:UDP-glucuronosyltransferase n=1 Tax=Elaeophora elaphi TaxID=1147741 RepID=A0A0R3RJ00_9BILA